MFRKIRYTSMLLYLKKTVKKMACIFKKEARIINIKLIFNIIKDIKSRYKPA